MKINIKEYTERLFLSSCLLVVQFTLEGGGNSYLDFVAQFFFYLIRVKRRLGKIPYANIASGTVPSSGTRTQE